MPDEEATDELKNKSKNHVELLLNLLSNDNRLREFFRLTDCKEGRTLLQNHLSKIHSLMNSEDEHSNEYFKSSFIDGIQRLNDFETLSSMSSPNTHIKKEEKEDMDTRMMEAVYSIETFKNAYPTVRNIGAKLIAIINERLGEINYHLANHIFNQDAKDKNNEKIRNNDQSEFFAFINALKGQLNQIGLDDRNIDIATSLPYMYYTRYNYMNHSKFFPIMIISVNDEKYRIVYDTRMATAIKALQYNGGTSALFPDFPVIDYRELTSDPSKLTQLIKKIIETKNTKDTKDTNPSPDEANVLASNVMNNFIKRNKVNASIKKLETLDLKNYEKILDWMCELEKTGGYLNFFDKQNIIDTFENNGFDRISIIRKLKNESSKDFAEYIIAQALDGITRSKPYNLIHDLTKQWKEKFGEESLDDIK